MYIKTLKPLLILLLLLHTVLFAEDFTKPPYDLRLNQNQYGKIWYDHADTDYEAAYNIGVFYDEKMKDYKWAEFWYKKSWSIHNNANSSNNLGILYEDKKKYNQAIKWYMNAYSLNQDKDAINNLGLIYDNLHKYKKAKTWYKKAIKRESLEAIKNLSLLYYQEKNYIKSVEYMIALCDKTYTKKKVFALFRTHWKFDETTIEKGYQAQLKSKIIPEKLKYKGGL